MNNSINVSSSKSPATNVCIKGGSVDSVILKGVYLVTEPQCLNPNTGAGRHIIAGLNELKKRFSIELLEFNSGVESRKARILNPQHKGNTGKLQRPRFTYLRGIVKWFYLLFSYHKSILQNYRLVRKRRPDFIYERASYLNFNGLLIAKLLKIPHYYEVNGVLSMDNSEFFPGFLNRLAFRLERMAYQRSCGFYVGGINEVYKVPSDRCMVVQNGVDGEFVTSFHHRKNIVDDKIHLTFIGHAMSHHKLDILFDALSMLKNPDRFYLHLIGSNFDTYLNDVPRRVKIEVHGQLNHQEIGKRLGKINVGIIMYALPYFSHVKAFMYGAAKLLVILPRSTNFTRIFTDDEVLFIKNNDAADLADKLDEIACLPNIFEKYGNAIHNSVKNKFTWEKIYEPVIAKIAGDT